MGARPIFYQNLEATDLPLKLKESLIGIQNDLSLKAQIQSSSWEEFWMSARKESKPWNFWCSSRRQIWARAGFLILLT